jgi:hypothetical protein
MCCGWKRKAEVVKMKTPRREENKEIHRSSRKRMEIHARAGGEKWREILQLSSNFSCHHLHFPFLLVLTAGCDRQSVAVVVPSSESEDSRASHGGGESESDDKMILPGSLVNS